MLALGWGLTGVAVFIKPKLELGMYRLLVLLFAILQTIGAMIVAACDIDIDIFAKRYPWRVLLFAVAWIVLFEGLQALIPPITTNNIDIRCGGFQHYPSPSYSPTSSFLRCAAGTTHVSQNYSLTASALISLLEVWQNYCLGQQL
jgi:hypothetical protein